MTDPTRAGCPAHQSQIGLDEFIADPHGATAAQRRRGWFTTMPDTKADCVSLTHEAARDLLSHDHLAASFQRRRIELMALNEEISAEHRRHVADQPPSFLDLHGADHRAVRALFSAAFTPRMIERLRPATEAHAARLASALDPGCDFMDVFAAPFPGDVLCEVLGVPHEDRGQFMGWVDRLETSLSPAGLLTMTIDGSLDVLDADREFGRYSADLIAARRQTPGDDLISAVVSNPDCDLDDAELAVHLAALLFAGTDTTRKMLGTLVHVLASHPREWEQLRAEPDRAAIVVEELLRWQSAVSGAARTVLADFDHHDRQFTTGESVVVALWAANRDPAVYEDPDRFLPDRWKARPQGHLSFGHGPHFCLGAALARHELRTAAIALTSRFSTIEVTECEMTPPIGIAGPTRLIVNLP